MEQATPSAARRDHSAHRARRVILVVTAAFIAMPIIAYLLFGIRVAGP